MILHDKQREVVRSNARFKVTRAGRRGGKSTLEEETCSFKAITKNDQNILYLAPTQKQARAIIWEEFKRRLSPIGAVFNEARLEIKVPTQEGGNSTIYVGGWENRENYRGMRFHHITFDELDTLKDFFIGWQEIFRPALTDTQGTADFIGTPKSESRNLARMEKIAETDHDYATFHFTSYDNPHVLDSEIDKAKLELAFDTFKQEYLAEYIDHQGALFNYSALVDVFSNTVDRTTKRYMIVDVAGDGSDRCVFGFWEGLVEYKRLSFDRLNSSSIREKIREFATTDRIPFSQIIVDAVGVGEHLPHDPLLDGIIGFKSSYAPIKTDQDIVRLPNVKYVEKPILVSDYKNLRSQCIFTLADLVNNHKIASEVTGEAKEKILEELPLYQDASKGDGKRFATPKEEIKEMLGRSPDDSDTWIMRMYFEVMGRMLPHQSEARANLVREMQNNRLRVRNNQSANSAR
jgi:hypothetical protein